MCCLVTILLFLGPRFALVAWYLMEPARFSNAINSLLLSCCGFFFLPWTMLAYLAVWSAELGVTGFGWVIVAFGFFIDISAYSGGGYGNRKRVERYL